MTVTIRTLKDSPHRYLASASSICGGSTYLLCFSHDIFGAMSLHDFTEMLRKHFNLSEVQLAFRDARLDPDAGFLLSLFREHE